MLSVRLFGMDFVSCGPAEVILAAEAAPAAGPRQIVTANVDHVISLADHPRFRRAYAGAAARTLDGMPLVWLARLRGLRQARRVTGHDLLAALLTRPHPEDRRVFMVCASETAGRVMTERLAGSGLPAGRVAWAVPPRGFEGDPEESGALADAIAAHRTTVLIMGVGAPKSEIWVDRQGPALGSPVVLDIGEALNVAAGLVPRAPVVMQRLGLEWLFRFGTQPRRLFHRYFVRSWRFLALAITQPDLAAGPGLRSTGAA